ncbi:MAG TPA: META domain-containing protein [Longimicrobium sp.]|uniref:META domain-containing protein n=1 Tax=Longimicrobium sp. TaxID=2029185 RepID=UPI002EDB0936
MRRWAGVARLPWLGMMILALAACMGPRVAGAGGEGEPLAGTRWTLAELNGQAPVPGLGNATPTLEFAAGEARASGDGGCNQFSGPYTQDGAALRFGPLVSTRRACADEAANRQETAYLRALESTTRFTATAEMLVLYAGDQAVAQLSRTAE